MPLPHEYTFTIDDIYALPEGNRAELIDGRMYMMAPPNILLKMTFQFVSTKI